MAPLRPGLALVRRAVGVIAVVFLLSCAVAFYAMAPSLPSSGATAPPTTGPTSSSPPPVSQPPAGEPSSSEAPPSEPPVSESPTSEPPTTTPSVNTSSSSAAKSIEIEDFTPTVKSFQAVQIRGIYHGGPNTFVYAQRLEEGKWLSFPLPTKTDGDGRFILYGALDRPGGYWFRVIDPNSGLASQQFAVIVRAA
jgi:hypothetical protein